MNRKNPWPADSVERRPTETLLPSARNARKHSEKQVAQIVASIKEWGWTTPVLIDETGEIIAGHGRVMAAKKLGLPDVPVMVAKGWSDEQKRAYMLADNKLTLLGEWDEELLSIELGALKGSGFDLELTGFDAVELAGFLDTEAGRTDPDDAPPPPSQAVSLTGDVWIMGRHRLVCGDSTKAEDVARALNGARAALCFTSPPYADQREYVPGTNVSVGKLAQFIPAAADGVRLFAVNLGLSRKDGAVNRYWDEYIVAAEACGLKLLSWNVWNKGVQGSVGQLTAMFPIAHEWIFVFGYEKGRLNKTVKNKSGGQKRDVADRQRDGTVKRKPAVAVSGWRAIGTVLDLHGEMARNKDNSHPATFPVGLPQSYIEACTKPGDAVYEPFSGSGTTIIAAEMTARACHAIELSPAYVDVAVTRWEKFTGKHAVLEATGQTFEEVAKCRA